MDNKITKPRLSNFLAYRWIGIIGVICAGIVLLELLFTTLAIRVSAGQSFKFYYDEAVVGTNGGNFRELIEKDKGKPEGTFSYDVLEVNFENLTSDSTNYNILSLRLTVNDGDAIITSAKEEDAGEGKTKSRIKELIDGYPIYDLDSLFNDAVSYLAKFRKDGVGEGVEFVTDYNNLDEVKIKDNFIKRLGKDNRYRVGEISVNDEYARIRKLCEDVKDFKKILDYSPEGNQIFFEYTKYEQTLNFAETQDDKSLYEELYQKEKQEETALGRKKRYAFLPQYFPTADGKGSIPDNFRLIGESDGTDTAIAIFNQLSAQPDLQFETVSFIVTIMKNFTTVLDA